MGALCGWVGRESNETLSAMLAAVPYRGQDSTTYQAGGFGVGLRYDPGEPITLPGNRSKQIVVGVGEVLSPNGKISPSTLFEPNGYRHADGAFSAVCHDTETMSTRLVRDPFGIAPLFYAQRGGTLYFATELKQLLAVPTISAEIDYTALHEYLTFSFVPSERTPIAGVRRLPPGSIGIWRNGSFAVEAKFALEERLASNGCERLDAPGLRTLVDQAIERRVSNGERVGVYLSGGLDSACVAALLREREVPVHTFSADFRKHGVELEEAKTVARHLGIPHTLVRMRGKEIRRSFWDFIWKLDLPYGDPVTAPQHLLGAAAHEEGVHTVFNGEGGDQFFGGWTAKPMLAREAFAVSLPERSREEAYLDSYHRFYGFEDDLYSSKFRARLETPDRRRALIGGLLNRNSPSYLTRVRLVDIGLKGMYNIVPRAEAIAVGWGLGLQMPLFDRALAEASFTLPPTEKLHGSCEKYILKHAMDGLLPDEIVWRKKSGMSVPMGAWSRGPLKGMIRELLGKRSLKKRGLFRSEYVGELRKGRDGAAETRGRRVGERLWTLAMLEAWLRVFVDGKGQRPESR